MKITEEKVIKVLNMFVGHDEIRPVMMSPFEQGGYYISTNGNHLVAIKSKGFNLDFNNDLDTPAAAGLLSKDLHKPIKIDLRLLKSEIDSKTPMVDQYEEEVKECYQCDGDGYQTCDLDHEHDCLKCEGEGEIKEHSKPTGVMVKKSGIYFKSKSISMGDYMINKLIDLCNLLEIDVVTKISGTKTTPSIYNVGEFTVLLCPVMYTEDDSKEVINLTDSKY